jgi:hypothetical protein
MSQKYAYIIGASLLVIVLADIILTDAFGFDMALFSPKYDQFEFGFMLVIGLLVGVTLVMPFDAYGKTEEDKIKLRRSQKVLRSLMVPCFAMLVHCFAAHRFDFEQMPQAIMGVAGFCLGYFATLFIMSECVLDHERHRIS